ncbi:MAG: DUF6531 domain-containing protein, partial [FCB group bacterium]|nr:DUF6531 domain-containing protein [FCB group bacterium]
MGAYEYPESSMPLLRVTIQPIASVQAGAAWSVVKAFWRESGTALPVPPRTYTVYFREIDGWIAPQPMTVTVVAGEDMEVTASYVAVGGEGDRDGDGLPDWWEELHGLHPGDAEGDNGAQGDPDGDDLSNADEYRLGFAPNNSDTTDLQEVYNTFLKAELRGVPNPYRTNRAYTFWIYYKNTHPSRAIPAPLFEVAVSDGVLTRFSDTEPWSEGNIQLLGLGLDANVRVLQPGDSMSVPVQFTASRVGIYFELSLLSASTDAVPWDGIEADVRPDVLDTAVWDRLWPVLTDQIGVTWADYQGMLRENAGYLGGLGRRVPSVHDLFAFEARQALGINPNTYLVGGVDAAAPAPGLPLVFARAYMNRMDKHQYDGPLGYGWTHSYDVYANVDADGNVFVHQGTGFDRRFVRNADGGYDALSGDTGKLTGGDGAFVLTADGGSVLTFNAANRLGSIADANGNSVALAYGAGDKLASVTHSCGHAFTLAYSGNLIASITDQAGRVTGYSYDGSNNLTGVAAQGGLTTAYTYAPSTGGPLDHAMLGVTGPTGITTTFSYDVYGRQVGEALGGGAEAVTCTYDSVGRLTVQDAMGGLVQLEPDEFGRPARTGDSLNRDVEFGVDGKGNLTSVTGPDGAAVSIEYDHMGNVLRSVDPAGGELRFSYDYGTDSLKSITDPRGNTTRFGADAQGNLETVTYPDNSIEQFQHDGAGNLVSATNRRGQTIAYEYNSAGQVTRKLCPGMPAVEYGYDSAGRLASVTDGSGVTSMQYDARGFMTYIGYPSGHWFAYEYNAAGQRTRRTGDDGFVLDYSYDAAGRLMTVSNGNGYQYVTYSYDAAGRLSGELKGNGTRTGYAYDQAGQLLSITHYAPDNSVQAFFNYEYDINGNRIAETNKDGRTTYTYDLLGQLTGEHYPDGHSVTYVYDPAGNRTQVIRDGIVENYVTNSMNQYVLAGGANCTYDADGNMISKTDETGTTTYVWDAENRLVEERTPTGEVSKYSYDAFGNLISKEAGGVTVQYLMDSPLDGQAVSEIALDSGKTSHRVSGIWTIARDMDSAKTFYGFDAAGNEILKTNNAARIVGNYAYTAFGIFRDRGDARKSALPPSPLRNDADEPSEYERKPDGGFYGAGISLTAGLIYDAMTGRAIKDQPGAHVDRKVENRPLKSPNSDVVGDIGVAAVTEVSKNFLSVVEIAMASAGAKTAAQVFASANLGTEAWGMWNSAYKATNAILSGDLNEFNWNGYKTTRSLVSIEVGYALAPCPPAVLL